MEKHPLHLKNPELQISSDVEHAVERDERKAGEEIPNDPSRRIQSYLDRLEKIFLNEDEDARKRNVDMFRHEIYDALVIKKENFPESFFDLQKKIARERGQAVEEIPQETRDLMINTAIEDQKHSLDVWVDYLTSSDAVYPVWFKYYVWNQIIKLSQFDKERGEFKKRTATTVAPFPDIYREPLAQIADIYERVKDNNKDIEARQQFDRKFPSLYAELTLKSLASSIENREEIVGKWVKYNQNEDGAAEKLFKSLENKGTGWCTAGRSTAETQVKSGDFYVYYTNNSTGEAKQPRIAIRMEGSKTLAEVRGILPHQEVEPLMQDILDEKLKEFGSEADVYRQKVADMRLLTELEKKQQKAVPFTKDELVFLYEIDKPIKSFGYQKDPRIKELLDNRSKERRSDIATILGIENNQVAESLEQLNDSIRVYVGKWEPEVARRAHKNTIIYEEFPKRIAFCQTITIKPNVRTAQDALALLEHHNFPSGEAKEEILKMKFDGHEKSYKLAAFSAKQLFPWAQQGDISMRQIALALGQVGLRLCPGEIIPFLREQYKGEPTDKFEYFQVFDNRPASLSGVAHIFVLKRPDHAGDPRRIDLEIYKTSSDGWDSRVPVDRKYIFSL